MKKIIFDADMLLFVNALNAEKPIHWYDDLWTLHCNMSDVITAFDKHVKDLLDIVLDHYNYTGEYVILMALSDNNNNFRKELCPEYKANRKGKRRPLVFHPMREWIMDNYDYLLEDNLEADDLAGLTADIDDIVISGDKDYKSLPTHFYDFMRNEFHDGNEETSHYWHMYQTLIGDSADNYKGCPSIGDVRAKRILDKDPSWCNVLQVFLDNNCTEDEALLQARLARILHKGEYDFKTKKVKLWLPD